MAAGVDLFDFNRKTANDFMTELEVLLKEQAKRNGRNPQNPAAIPQNLPETAQNQDIPPQQDILSQIEDDDLSHYILERLREDISDKEESDWKSRRTYEINAYYGIKPKTDWPWYNASNFPVPLTRTLVDTAQANIMGSIFNDPQDTTQVDGVGPEDKQSAKPLESLLNWQLYEEIEAYKIWDKIVFRSLTSPAGIAKVMYSNTEKKVWIESIAGDDVFLPLDAKGFQVKDTDHVFQIIPLNDIDFENRKALGVYENLDQVPKGFSIRQGSLSEIVTQAKDVASGTKMDQRNKRDMRYIMECYLTYPHKPKGTNDMEPAQMVELVVWCTPNGGTILRKVMNEDGKRPFVEVIPYPKDDRFWGESLPEVIRPIQEELDYSHNQNINAADIAMRPPMFYRAGSSLEIDEEERVPGGAHPVPDPKDIVFQPTQSIDPIFERQEDRYWDLAERLTGLTELFQGRQPQSKQTATLTIRRENRAEIRFKTLYQRYEYAWSKMLDLIYYYDTKFMPKDKVVKVIGVTDSFKKVGQIFPQGIEGNYNFKFASSPLTEKEARKQRDIQLVEFLIASPLVISNARSLWNVTKKLAEALGENNLEGLVVKPKEANVAGADEAIQRIMSGELDFSPEPGIDAENYMFRLEMFFKTDTFLAADPAQKAALLLLHERVKAVRIGQLKAIIAAQTHKKVMGAKAEAVKQNQNGGQNGSQGTKRASPNGSKPSGK